MHAASRACRAPGPRAAACARPLPHARFASRTHASAPLRAPGTPRPTYAAPVTRTDAVILRLQSRLAQIARPYSTQPINPALGPLGNVNTPPKDPDHWPPTMSFPVPFWILAFALLYLYLSDISASDTKECTPSDELKQCMHSRAKYAKHMLGMLRTADLFGIVRRDAAFDAFLPELISDAATSANTEVRRAARDLIHWLSEHAPYRHHLRPTVQQLSDMAYRTVNERDQMEATEMLYTMANLFERLTPQQRQELAPEVLSLCKHFASATNKDTINRIQLRPVARLMFRLHQLPELTASLAAEKSTLDTLAASSDPVTSAYAAAALQVAGGDAHAKVPVWLDSQAGAIGMEAAAAVAITAALTPFWARFNARWYTNPAKRVAWMNYSTLRSIPTAALAVPVYYGLRAINAEVVPYYPAERTSHSILPFGAAIAATSNILLRVTSPYWILPSMASLASGGLSSYHTPLWFRTAGAATPVADDFLREVPLHHALGFEEKVPPSPLQQWYWQEHPPRSERYETRVDAFVGAVKRALATPR